MGVISTSSRRAAERPRRPPPRRPARRATRSGTASSRTAAGPRPIASATRYATSAESMPPDRPSTASLEAGLAQLAADELADDPARDVGVDGQLRRAARTRARRDVAGPIVRGRTPRATSPGRHAGTLRVAPARARPHDPLQLAQRPAPGRSSRSSGSAIRSRRTSREVDVDEVQPLVVAAARRRPVAPVGPITSEPPQNVIDSSTPTRLQNTTNVVVSWAYVRISVRHELGRAQADLVGRAPGRARATTRR